MKDITIILNGEEYVVPKKYSYRQYYLLTNILTKDLDFKSYKDKDGNIAVIDLILGLHEKELIPKVLSVILKKKSDVKWDKKQIENVDPFYDVTEDEIERIIADFLAGRAELMTSLMNALENFTKENTGSISQLKEKVKGKTN